MHGMVFTQVLCRLIIFSVAVFLVSCAPFRILEVEVLQPAKVKIEKDKKVALLDRCIRMKDSPLTFAERSTEMELTTNFAQGINHMFVEMGYDTILPLAQNEAFFLKDSTAPTPLEPDTISGLCEVFNLDYIISLELQYFTVKEYLVTGYWMVRLYEDGKNMPIDSVLLHNTLPWIGYTDMDMLLQDIQAAFWDEGSAYARRLISYWEKTERRVYCQGKVLGMGDVFFQEGKTEEAIRIWQSALKLSNRKAIHGAINLAWVYENSGDFDTALKYLEETQELILKKGIKNSSAVYLKKYLQVIKNRIEQRNILDQQINSDDN